MKPALVIIGGYNSWWPTYLKPARDLEDVSGLPAVAVPLLPWNWWSANRSRDASQLLAKLAETVDWARRKYQARQFILVGHSAGGLLARLYVAEKPVWGQTYAGLEHVTDVITLGSPHSTQNSAEASWYLTDVANRIAPGAAYEPQVRYWSVAGKLMMGDPRGNYLQRRAYRAYEYFAGRGDVWGDGVVPVTSAGLEGAQRIVLDGVAHGRSTGPSWYAGSKDLVRRWWPSGDGRGT